MVSTPGTRRELAPRTIREAVPTSPGRPCIGSWRTRPRTQLGRWAGSVASSSTVARGRAMSIETVYLTSSTLSLGGRGARYSAPSGDANGFGPDPRRAVPESVCDRAGGRRTAVVVGGDELALADGRPGAGRHARARRARPALAGDAEGGALLLAGARRLEHPPAQRRRGRREPSPQ